MMELLSTLDSWVEGVASSDLVLDSLEWIHKRLGAVDRPFIDARLFVYSVLVTYLVLLASIFLFRRHRRNRLKRELQEAKAQLKYMQDKLQQMDQDKREVRIFMDGAFDLMHYGHMNAFRLGRSLGTHLVVGVNSDESITECKAAPLMNDQERLTLVSACKFVDEVVPGCPYIMNKDYLDYVIEKYRIDYVVHGDDPCIVNGVDVYAESKRRGKYRSIPRTEGVSTTDIVGRMLLLTKEHHMVDSFTGQENGDGKDNGDNTIHKRSQENAQSQHNDEQNLLSRQSKFLTTSRMLKLFSSGNKAPSPGMKVVFIDGSFDFFHPGHVTLLKMAKERGDFLIVGIHGDSVVNRILGMNLPLMNLHERVLSVLGCRFVDDVVIDAPFAITEAMVASLNISEVLQSPDTGYGIRDESDRFGQINPDLVYRIEQPCKFNLRSILQRIRRNQESFEARFERKMNAEKKFYETKHSSSRNE
mmetsp:Transcript_28184/g.77442  ORF Transcript_28184/g.77442 Transcript_28184/m.77442 type:complete len:473 (-) Transcript_28184:31-1449(-)